MTLAQTIENGAQLYVVGICLGVTLAILFFYHFVKGFGMFTASKISQKLPYVIAVLNVAYFIVKFLQILAVTGDCQVEEALSVLFYLGAL